MAALVGIALILGALCKRTCCPGDIAGSYVSVVSEGADVEEANEASGGAVTDPVTDAVARWARAEKVRVEGFISEVGKNPGGTQESEEKGAHVGQKLSLIHI